MDPQRSPLTVVRLCLAGLLVAATACSGAAEQKPPPPTPARIAKPAPPPPAATKGPRADVEVVYRDEWFGAVRLIGVDKARQLAYLRLEQGKDNRLIIDTVDLSAGKRIARWEATKANAVGAFRTHPAFHPMTGGFSEDLVRFAEILHSTGPWHTRGGSPAPAVAVSPDRQYILFSAPPDDGTDGDWLYVTDGHGQRPRRIDPGLRASYSPVFSPDGSMIAWQGCESSPCDYGLFVTKLGGNPDRVSAVSKSSEPVFSPKGRYLYALGHIPRQRCLYKIPADATWRAKKLHCLSSSLEDISFVQDAEGRTGVISGSRGIAGTQTAEYTWVLLETGEVLARHEVAGASGTGAISESGMMVVSIAKGGIAIVDLITGSRGAVEGTGWFFGLERTQWIDERVLLLRKPAEGRSFELVSINGRKVAVEPGNPASSTVSMGPSAN